MLDTTAITEAGLRAPMGGDLGETLVEAVRRITSLLAEARLTLGYRFYMAPSVMAELRRFLIANGVPPDEVEELLKWLTPRPPSRHSIMLPAAVLAMHVETMRRNITKGLRVAEEAARRGFRAGQASGEVGDVIRWVREHYREATRRGILDSLEDLDTVLLAYELKAVLVTSDTGVKRFAEELGIPVQHPKPFYSMIRDALRKYRETHARHGAATEG